MSGSHHLNMNQHNGVLWTFCPWSGHLGFIALAPGNLTFPGSLGRSRALGGDPLRSRGQGAFHERATTERSLEREKGLSRVMNRQKVQVSSMLSWGVIWHALVASMAGAGKQNVDSPEPGEDQGPDCPGPGDAGENSFLFRALRSRECDVIRPEFLKDPSVKMLTDEAIMDT